MNLQTFQKKIWDYYRDNKRNLPWRLPADRQGKLDPYKILVSEIMLQQTQVARVLKKYPEFLKVFPNVRVLAKAPFGNVLRVWQGMGYNRRAIALKKLAEEVINRHKGKIPLDFESLIALPGVGRSTAGAVMAFAADIPAVFIETNIRRVFIHFFFDSKRHSNILQNVRMSSGISDAEILRLVEKTLPKKNVHPVRGRLANPVRKEVSNGAESTATTALRQSASNGVREWYWALMDYGAMLGTGKMPNPNRRSVHYSRQSTFEGSNRQLRGKILNLLVEKKTLSLRQLEQKTEVSSVRIQQILKELMQEGFLLKTGAWYTLAR